MNIDPIVVLSLILYGVAFAILADSATDDFRE